MDFRVQAVLSAVWPTARRPLAPVVVLGIDILDALGMTSSEEASPPLVFEPEPGVVQELREAVMIRTPPVEYEDIGRFWEVGIRHDSVAATARVGSSVEQGGEDFQACAATLSAAGATSSTRLASVVT